jgi:dihydrofolate synthase / folylpolyglutamate synthase
MLCLADKRIKIMNYQESMVYLESLNTFGIKLGLTRITRLLELMEQPQNRYKTIHITGTNGKGSTSVMLAQMLSQADIRTALYISPHLLSYTERMQIDGQCITEEDFAQNLTIVRSYVEKMVAEGEENPTQFEVLTAMAFLYFATKNVEYAVIEVGLGGLLDSTNVIVPEVSVITNVTFEHADRCGGTLEGIAEHKAGIIKDGVPVVTAAKGKALQIIRDASQAKNADIFVAGEDFHSSFVRFDGQRQHLQFNSDLLGVSAEYALQMLGEHQIENSALALMALHLLHNQDERINRVSAEEALAHAVWPGRFELLEKDGQQIVIDGAHNPAGMEVLRQNLDTYFPVQERVILLGILKDKDVDTMVEALLRPMDTVVVTMPHSERAAEPADIGRKIKAHHIELQPDNAEALARALELADKNRLLCIAGSLYLIGGVRQMLLAEK